MSEDVILSDEDGALVKLEALYYEHDAARKRGEEVVVDQPVLDNLIDMARKSKAPSSHPELRKLLDRPVDKIQRTKSGAEFIS